MILTRFLSAEGISQQQRIRTRGETRASQGCPQNRLRSNPESLLGIFRGFRSSGRDLPGAAAPAQRGSTGDGVSPLREQGTLSAGAKRTGAEPRGQEQPHGTSPTGRIPPGIPWSRCSRTHAGDNGELRGQSAVTPAPLRARISRGRGGFSPANGPETGLKASVSFNFGCAATSSGGRARISRGKRGKPNSRLD